MRQLKNMYRKTDGERNKEAVLRLEIDYELATLFEAMLKKDEEKKEECLIKLENLRKEFIKYG